MLASQTTAAAHVLAIRRLLLISPPRFCRHTQIWGWDVVAQKWCSQHQQLLVTTNGGHAQQPLPPINIKVPEGRDYSLKPVFSLTPRITVKILVGSFFSKLGVLRSCQFHINQQPAEKGKKKLPSCGFSENPSYLCATGVFSSPACLPSADLKLRQVVRAPPMM